MTAQLHGQTCFDLGSSVSRTSHPTSDRVVFDDPDYGHAVATKAGTIYMPRANHNICRVRDDVLLGGSVFANYTGESIGMHAASWAPLWISRDLLWATFDYPFNQLRVKRIFGQVPEDNTLARRFNENLGFRYVAKIEGVYRGGVACLVMRMDRDECRFLKIKPRRIVSNVIDVEGED
jgi:hypothetical protein